MARPAGSPDLPLHGGHVPKWLGDRTNRLGAVITEAIVLEYGLHRHVMLSSAQLYTNSV